MSFSATSVRNGSSVHTVHRDGRPVGKSSVLRGPSLATPSRSTRLEPVAHELHDYPQLLLAQERLDRADDSCMAADLERVAHLERSLATEVAGRDHLITAPHLIALTDLTHTACTIRESDALAAGAAGDPGVGERFHPTAASALASACTD
jgi:hypothetical protein